MRWSHNPANAKLAKGKKIERKHPEEEQLKAVIDAMGDGLVLVDMDGKIIVVNPAMEKIGGYPKSEVVGKDAADIISKVVKPEDMEKVMRVLENTLEGKTPPSGTYTLVTKDGREIPVAFTASFVKDAEGKPTAIVVTNKDITEFKRAEDELVRLSNAVRMSTDSIVISDLEGNIIDVNEATLKMYGTDDKRDLIGKNSFDIIAPEDREKALAGMKEVMKKGYVRGREYHINVKDGSKIPVEMSSSIMKGADGKHIGFVGITRDITERKKIEEERLKAVADNQRIGELEKFAKIAVGRELKMVELKGRIKELESKLKEITEKE